MPDSPDRYKPNVALPNSDHYTDATEVSTNGRHLLFGANRSYTDLLREIRIDQVLIAVYDGGYGKQAVHLDSEKEFQVFYSQHAQGFFVSFELYVCPKSILVRE
ncbi:hypothetical protein IPJ91_02140 [bacterium]|nr:MAG: hypothetical protein IPJ91_02140 [bacterium]